jgi:hypothetical protein
MSLAELCDRLFFDLVKADAYRKVYAGMSSQLRVETILRIAPTYFALTQTALLEMSCIIVTRLYDPSSRTVTLKYLLEVAAQKAGQFESGASDAHRGIEEARESLAEASGALNAVKTIRDKLLAHSDKTHFHLDALEQLPALDAEIGSLVDAGRRAVNAIRLKFDGVWCTPELLDVTDYEWLVHVLREGKKAQLRAAEEAGCTDEFLQMKKDLGLI